MVTDYIRDAFRPETSHLHIKIIFIQILTRENPPKSVALGFNFHFFFGNLSYQKQGKVEENPINQKRNVPLLLR